ncbi:hypothetical protein [Dyadobacter diqingensis]|uniref:hypothetical protein n=1 Tax=Dyadobacter diqingensis TaxID=2938121 RepID=UPI0020C1B130|nr:hypothetical protein [Dyadobacter diqingensis]
MKIKLERNYFKNIKLVTLETINRDLILIEDGSELLPNTVAVAIHVDENGIGIHSAILIGVDGNYSLFHFTAVEVLLEAPAPVDQWYFCKELEVIDGDEFSIDFLAHCQNIIKQQDPKFGYRFDGSYYDQDGLHFTTIEQANYTTCVGFCIRVISGFLQDNDEYFKTDDWTIESTRDAPINYFNKFYSEFHAEFPDVSEEIFWESCKRILPVEYTASAFFNSLPVRKRNIDDIVNNVQAALAHKRLNIQSDAA